MGIFDRLFGETPGPQKPAPAPPATSASSANSASSASSPAYGTADEEALRRYRYLLRTAPPEAIEQAHAEAFAQLTPEQRAQALRQLAQAVPETERRAIESQPDPQALARMATRAELRQPGVLERVFGGGGMFGGGGGMGSAFAGSLLGSIAGGFIGSAIAHHFLGGYDQPSAFMDDGSAGYGSPELEGHDPDNDVAYNDDPDDIDPGDDFGDLGDFGDDI